LWFHSHAHVDGFAWLWPAQVQHSSSNQLGFAETHRLWELHAYCLLPDCTHCASICTFSHIFVTSMRPLPSSTTIINVLVEGCSVKLATAPTNSTYSSEAAQ
jgi:hypothetical protein